MLAHPRFINVLIWIMLFGRVLGSIDEDVLHAFHVRRGVLTGAQEVITADMTYHTDWLWLQAETGIPAFLGAQAEAWAIHKPSPSQPRCLETLLGQGRTAMQVAREIERAWTELPRFGWRATPCHPSVRTSLVLDHQKRHIILHGTGEARERISMASALVEIRWQLEDGGFRLETFCRWLRTWTSTRLFLQHMGYLSKCNSSHHCRVIVNGEPLETNPDTDLRINTGDFVVLEGVLVLPAETPNCDLASCQSLRMVRS